MTRQSKSVFAAALAVAALFVVSSALAAEKTLLNLDKNGVILDGYDPVAFFTENKPVPGLPQIRSTYNGATYQFASAKNKALFDKDPAKYEPQFGGFCAYAASQGRTATIDVSQFTIVNGRLLLQYSDKALRLWNQNVQGHLEDADALWPAIVAGGGKAADPEKVLGHPTR